MTLQFQLYKNPNRPTLTLLHGDSLDHRQWQPQVDYFKKDFQILTYDLRGYGKSPFPTSSYNHAEDLKSLLNLLGITTTHLIGSSFGGENAIDFTLLYPQMVNSLTLIDSSLSGFPCTVDWDVGTKTNTLAQAKQNWLNHPVFETTKKYPLAYQTLTTMVNDYSGHYWTHKDLRQKLEPRAYTRLHKITTPTQIIIGEYDLPYFHDIAKYIIDHTSHLAHRTSHIIPHSGHLPNLEQPEIINKIVETGLTQCNPSP